MVALQHEKAKKLRALHEGVLVMANAWDALSSTVLMDLGYDAIGTTSGAISWTLGRRDGEGVSRGDMLRRLRDIVEAVTIPVNADIERGFGRTTANVATTARQVLEAGAAGANIEDAISGRLRSVESQVARIQAVRDGTAEVPAFVINARTDVWLTREYEGIGRLDELKRRTEAYVRAGADVIFVPGLLDLEVLRLATAASPVPVNVMAAPGGPTVDDLAAAGVRRISIGTALAEVAVSAVRDAAREFRDTGALTRPSGALSYSELNALFSG